MYPEDPEQIAALGEDAERLLRGVTSWVTRRKETITVADDRIVRRMMSVDFQLPDWVKVRERPGCNDDERDRQVISYAPLFFLQKGSDDLPRPAAALEVPQPHFAGFDLRDEQGRAMSLPPRTWNAKVSIQAMRVALRRAAHAHDISLSESAESFAAEALEIIATAERNDAVRLLQDLRSPKTADKPELASLHAALLASDELAWLVAACAVASIVMVPLVGHDARWGIVKLAYNQEVEFARLRLLPAAAGLSGYHFWFDAPFIGAGTYHVEIPAPAGMEIYDAGLIQVDEYGTNPDPLDHEVTLQRASGFAQQVHLYVDDASNAHGAMAWIRIRSRRREFVVGAAFLASLISAVLWIGFGLTDDVREASPGTTALLLLFPGAAATYAARAGRHAIDRMALFVARGLLVFSAAAAFLAAGVIALSHRESGVIAGSAFETWLLGLALASSAATVLLWIAVLLPQPQIRWQLLASPGYLSKRHKKPEGWQPWFARPHCFPPLRWASKWLTGKDQRGRS